MNDENLINRLERFERLVATCLCMLPLLFSAQCLVVALGAPVFSAMYVDFGARLPGLTHFVLDSWPLWALVAVIVPITCIVFARKANPHFSVACSTVAGLGMFLLAQTITGAMFLPIMQLGAVAGGLK